MSQLFGKSESESQREKIKELMAKSGLEEFKAYQKSLKLFDLVVKDMSLISNRPMCARLVGQQVASADSICSNIEEGYGRGSKKDYARFLVIARGSAQETRGRYLRMKEWLHVDDVRKSVGLCDEIIAILTSSIRSLKGV